MKKILYIFCLLWLFFIKKINTILLCHYFGVSKGYIIIIKIGHPCDPLIINVNMGIDFNFMVDDKFNKFASNYLVLHGSERIKYEDKEISAEKFSDTLTISFRYNISNFMFYLIEKSNNITDIGAIGLAYKFRDTKCSLIHQLKEQHFIDKLAFGFSPELTEEDEGEIYLGGIPEPIKNQKEYASLSVKDNDKYWACNLQYVYFNNTIQNGIIINDFTYFQSNSQYIQVPNAFFQILLKVIFVNYLENNVCILVEKNNKKQLICNCSELKDFPNISFVIDGIVFEFNNLELFERHYNNKCDAKKSPLAFYS